MTGTIHVFGDVRVLVLAESGARLERDSDAVDALSEASGEPPHDWLAIPVQRFAPACFDLETRQLGELLQKFVTYGQPVAIVGDISAHEEASSAFRDFVREANSGRQVWFALTVAHLGERLASLDAGR